jgi:hypothetical protein
MGYLLRSGGLSVSNSPYISLSTWIRVPSASIVQTPYSQSKLFLVAATDLNYDYLQIYINFNFFPGINHSIQFGVTASAPQSGGSHNDDAGWGTSGIAFAFDTWHHVFIAMDTNHAGNSPTDTGPYPDPPLDPKKGICFFDGVNISPIGNGTLSQNKTIPGESGYYPHTVAWSAGVSGIPVGVPFLDGMQVNWSGQVTPIIEMSDYQLWVGQFIDPTVSGNFSKFVKISGGKGTLVDPAIAAAAFGQQTILFKGNSTQFPVNRGIGGAFSLVGTNTDFTPTPSYG